RLLEVAPEHEGGAITVRLAEFVARRDIGHAFAEAEVLEPRRLADMEVIDGMQVVIEAGFSHLFGAKTAAVVDPTLDNEDVESTLGKIRAEHEAVMAAATDDAIGVAFDGVQGGSLVLCFCAPLRRSESCGQDRKNTGSSAQRRADGKSGKEPFNVARCRRALGQIFIGQLGYPLSPWRPDTRKRGLAQA